MTTYSSSIAAGDDDAVETGGTMNLSQTSLNANSTGQYIGLRFPGVTIPQGSTINSAVLSCFLISTSYDDPLLVIYADDTDNSAAMTTATNNISSRTSTTATVAYSGTGLGTGYKDTPDIKTVIQEITDRGGWSSGNALTLILNATSSASLYRIRSYEGNSSQAATLTVDYTPPAAGGAGSKTRRIRLTSRIGGSLT
jgi:hypothetical protein